MIESLHLMNFKNFQDAKLSLGKLTLLVGTNASGKSNLRDAFLFLHVKPVSTTSGSQSSVDYVYPANN